MPPPHGYFVVCFQGSIDYSRIAKEMLSNQHVCLVRLIETVKAMTQDEVSKASFSQQCLPPPLMRSSMLISLSALTAAEMILGRGCQGLTHIITLIKMRAEEKRRHYNSNGKYM